MYVVHCDGKENLNRLWNDLLENNFDLKRAIGIVIRVHISLVDLDLEMLFYYYENIYLFFSFRGIKSVESLNLDRDLSENMLI